MGAVEIRVPVQCVVGTYIRNSLSSNYYCSRKSNRVFIFNHRCIGISRQVDSCDTAVSRSVHLDSRVIADFHTIYYRGKPTADVLVYGHCRERSHARKSVFARLPTANNNNIRRNRVVPIFENTVRAQGKHDDDTVR